MIPPLCATPTRQSACRCDPVRSGTTAHDRRPPCHAMAEQLRHLIEMTKLATVSVRVLPLSAGPHRGAVAGTFYILDFPPSGRGAAEPTTVYSESLTGALYLDKPDEVTAYDQVWASLEALARDERESRKMIDKIIGEIHNE